MSHNIHCYDDFESCSESGINSDAAGFKKGFGVDIPGTRRQLSIIELDRRVDMTCWATEPIISSKESSKSMDEVRVGVDGTEMSESDLSKTNTYILKGE